MAVEAGAQAGGQPQGYGAGNGQGDPGGGLRCPAWRGGGYDIEEAGREELARRKRDLAGGAQGGKLWPATFCLGE